MDLHPRLIVVLLGLLSIANAIELRGQEEVKPPKLFEHLKADDPRIGLIQRDVLRNIREEASAVSAEPIIVITEALRAKTLTVNFDSKSMLTADTARIKPRSEGGFSWTGIVGKSEAGEPLVATFIVRGEKKTGYIPLNEFVYEIRPIGGEIHALIKRDPQNVPPDHPEDAPGNEGAAGDRKNDTDDRESSQPKTTEITLLFLYTAAVEQKHGAQQMDLHIESLVDQYLNPTMTRAATGVEFTSVHSQRVDYTESGSLVTDARHLRNPCDGEMDEIHGLRDRHKADIVVLLVIAGKENGRKAAGYSAEIAADASRAFSVVVDEYAGFNFSLAHEIGHLFGCRHDDDPTDRPYSWAHGYRNTRKAWHTIMGSNRRGSKRLDRWSDPKSRNGPDVLGTPDNDCVRLFRIRATTVAAFRS